MSRCSTLTVFAEWHEFEFLIVHCRFKTNIGHKHLNGKTISGCDRFCETYLSLQSRLVSYYSIYSKLYEWGRGETSPNFTTTVNCS